MRFDPDTAIRLLTIITLSGLLFSSGLQLTWGAVAGSLRQSRLAWIVPANFLLVPALVLGLVWLFRIPTDIAVGMLLLAAAPFAPVVPTFTRLARGDLALAGGLTGLFPFLSAFLTPLVCELSLKPILQTSALKFNVASILLVLVSTITLPLAAGTALRHYSPGLAAKLVKPVQVFSEAIGAIALGFATVTEFPTMRSIGWQPLLAMAIASELSFLAGYLVGGPAAASRVVVALGTANRNIALALLVAVASFPGTPIVATVVANGLLLILFGLAHVGWWRFFVAVKT
jgi:BASS family bile acid:Na+ symporter